MVKARSSRSMVSPSPPGEPEPEPAAPAPSTSLRKAGECLVLEVAEGESPGSCSTTDALPAPTATTAPLAAPEATPAKARARAAAAAAAAGDGGSRSDSARPSCRSSSRSCLIAQLLVHVSSRVRAEVSALFATAVHAAEHVAWSGVVGREGAPATPSAKDFPEIVRDLRILMHTTPVVAALSFILHDGSALFIKNETGLIAAGGGPREYDPFVVNEAVLPPANTTANTTLIFYYFKDDGSGRAYVPAPSFLRINKNYDPRIFPYYTAAATRRESNWNSNLAPSLGASALSVSVPFFDSAWPLDPAPSSKFLGVAAATLDVQRLSAFLADLVVTAQGLAVVLATVDTGERFLVAYRSPQGTPGARPLADPTYGLIPARNATDPLLRAFIEVLPVAAGASSEPGDGTISGRFSHGGTTYAWRHSCVQVATRSSRSLYRSPPSRRGEILLVIGVASPYADFRSLVSLNLVVTCTIGSICCVLVAGIFVAVSIEITRQLRVFFAEVEA
eukprot:tig00001042_g6606.t1